ncbi:hypothetical protein C5935_11925 [Cronobacter sakazakii]|uniref:hypothetical protein n=1 Tax=Cronobacter sakazakii TaxID=28141 RepID=UPI000CF0C315|nr:hypothetical protein [Cronobacter sakazakii]PPY11692.1 hypothetical protein C3D82_05165 [Cronobacter sakazakii]PQY95811.1 hypothetical protein C5935_11925 [Cronobacter sakazakii]PQY99263.1 hypothetical protein C5953_13605 [Cronobacter sakazakii]
MGYPLPDRAAAGRVNLQKRPEIPLNKTKNSDLTQNEAVYVYKILSKCISNAVRFGKEMIKKRGLAE